MSAQRPLFLASNRDEFYARKALPAHHWEDFKNVYAGRDLQGGGTWLGLANHKDPEHVRFATLTNVRDVKNFNPDAPTRGNIVKNFLTYTSTPADFLDELKKDVTPYNGYNLLFGDKDTLYWYSNYGKDHPLNGKPLKPGIYALSNALLDTPWPKLTRVRSHFTQLFNAQAPISSYFDMLSDTTPADDELLPKTGLSYSWEKMLSAIAIKWDIYGTRASTLVELYNDKSAILTEKIWQTKG